MCWPRQVIELRFGANHLSPLLRDLGVHSQLQGFLPLLSSMMGVVEFVAVVPL
jgi:hypothetical protein